MAEDEGNEIPEQFICEQCNEEFKTKTALMSHVRNKHPEAEGGGKPAAPLATLKVAFPQKLGKYDTVTPEAVVDALKLQDGDYKVGFKDGILMLMLAARLNQELAGMQSAQLQPLIQMLQAMREEEKVAVERDKARSLDIAREAAAGVAEAIAPAFDSLKSSITALSPDPMKAMMVDVMRPVFKTMMNMFMPGMQGGAQGSILPSGWEEKK